MPSPDDADTNASRTQTKSSGLNLSLGDDKDEDYGTSFGGKKSKSMGNSTRLIVAPRDCKRSMMDFMKKVCVCVCVCVHICMYVYTVLHALLWRQKTVSEV